MDNEKKENCLKLLNSTQDSEKFVGLVLLMKCAKVDEREFLVDAWHAMKAKFLIRMLKTQGGSLEKMFYSFIFYIFIF